MEEFANAIFMKWAKDELNKVQTDDDEIETERKKGEYPNSFQDEQEPKVIQEKSQAKSKQKPKLRDIHMPPQVLDVVYMYIDMWYMLHKYITNSYILMITTMIIVII